MTIRVLIADDQMMVREGFSVLLERDAGHRGRRRGGQRPGGGRPGRASSRPDVVLMDIRMPELNGIEATREIVAADGGAKVLVLTTFDLDEYVYQALRAGASGFLLKDASARQLADGVRVVAAGEALLAPSVTRRLITEFSKLSEAPRLPATAQAAYGDLTERETEVLVLIAQGLSNAEIAAAPGGRRVDDQDPCEPDPGEAGPAGPHPGGGVRVRGAAGHAGLSGRTARSRATTVRRPWSRGRGLASGHGSSLPTRFRPVGPGVRRRPVPRLRGAAGPGPGRTTSSPRASGWSRTTRTSRRCCGTGGWGGRTCTGSRTRSSGGRRRRPSTSRSTRSTTTACSTWSRRTTPGSGGWCRRRSPRARWSGCGRTCERLAGELVAELVEAGRRRSADGRRRAAAGRGDRRDAGHPGGRPGAAAALVGGHLRDVRAEPVRGDGGDGRCGRRSSSPSICGS